MVSRRLRLEGPALVLRRWPYAETSLTARLLTPGHGTLPVLAKGCNRPTSGRFGVLDTWALVDAVLVGREDEGMFELRSGRLTERFAGLSADPRRMAAAAVLAELAEEAAPPGQAAPQVFRWLLGALERLAGLPAGADVGPTVVAEVLAGLRLLGLEPVLEAPAAAHGEALWFLPASGGVVASTLRPAPEARPLRRGTLELLRLLAAEAPGPETPPPPAAETDLALTIVGDFLRYHLERLPRAWPALLQRRRRPARRRPPTAAEDVPGPR